jgi:hypothetical protein
VSRSGGEGGGADKGGVMAAKTLRPVLEGQRLKARKRGTFFAPHLSLSPTPLLDHMESHIICPPMAYRTARYVVLIWRWVGLTRPCRGRGKGASVAAVRSLDAGHANNERFCAFMSLPWTCVHLL